LADFCPGTRTGIERAEAGQMLERVFVFATRFTLDLHRVELESEPLEVLQHCFCEARAAALGVEIFESEDDAGPLGTGVEPTQQPGEQCARVRRARGRGREATGRGTVLRGRHRLLQ